MCCIAGVALFIDFIEKQRMAHEMEGCDTCGVKFNEKSDLLCATCPTVIRARFS